MPAVTCLGHKSTGHDNCPPVEAVEASSNVFVNGKPVVLVGDKYAPHGCDKHAEHQGYLAEGSPSVFINGKPVGRVGDAISCGGTVAEGSSNVFIGNGNEQKLNKAICKRNEIVTRYKRCKEDDIFFCLPLIAEEMGNKANEKDRIGWHYLRDMFYKWLSGEANTDAKSNPSPFWVDIDWVLSYPLVYDWENTFPDLLITKKATDQLSDILAREGYLTQQDCEFDFINTNWTEWEKLYYQQVNIKYKDSGVLTGLFASLGGFTIGFLSKGKIKYLGKNQYEVTIEEAAGFVRDSFNFEGKATPLGDFLGFWNCEDKRMNLYEFIDGQMMSNARFRDFREHNKIGNDFLVLSKPKLIDNFIKYTYSV